MIALPWVIFVAFVLVLLAMDLGVFNRTPHAITMRESLVWTAVWIGIAMLFNVVLYFAYENHWLGIGDTVGHEVDGRTAAIEFLTGYLIEKSLSIDNIFVIALIFSYFKVPREYQHRTLFWGIVGALVMRGAMIAAGAALLRAFSWTNYLFGGVLLFTAAKMLVTDTEHVEPENSILVRIAKRLYRYHPGFEGSRFFTRASGKHAMTTLFVVLLAVEGADVLFAVDSIPAIFAVTEDPFLVFTSNIFAILGLRSLFFALSAMLAKFKKLQASLVFLLAFIGVKMILARHFHIPPWVSLSVIVGILTVGGVASWWSARVERKREESVDVAGDEAVVVAQREDPSGWPIE